MNAITIGSHVIYNHATAQVIDQIGEKFRIMTNDGDIQWVSVYKLTLDDTVPDQPTCDLPACTMCRTPIYESCHVINRDTDQHWHMECFPAPPSKRHLL